MPEQSRARNVLELPLAEFRRGTEVFSRKRVVLGPALLSFEGGFLSIESGEVTAVLRATGEWHGRATFSPNILRAVATVPPIQNPLTIAYADGHLLIGSITVPCKWRLLSQALIHDLEHPSLMDLLVLERTLDRFRPKNRVPDKIVERLLFEGADGPMPLNFDESGYLNQQTLRGVRRLDCPRCAVATSSTVPTPG